MTGQLPLPDDASRQADRLDAFLDRIAIGDPAPPSDLNPSLAAAARRIHELASDSVAADIRGAGKARRWEHLMQTPMLPSVVTPFPGSRTPPPSTPMPVLLRPAARPSRLRRWADGSLGLVATLTLVLLVAAAGAGMYLTMPGGQAPDDTAPTLAGVAVGTPSPLAVEREPGDPRLVLPPCDTNPLSYSQIMGVLERHYFPANEDGRVGTVRLALPLPEGPVPDGAVLDELNTVLVQMLSCHGYLDRRAALSTDGGIIRTYIYTEGYRAERVDGERLLQLWLQAEGIATTLSHRRVHSYAMTEVRTLRDGRIAGYLTIELEFARQSDGTFTHPGNGYIVFAEQGGRWLVDDFQPWVIG